MRRLFCFAVLVTALAIPAAAFALSGLGGSDEDGTLSVKAGIGNVRLNFTGSAVGRIQRGYVQVTDPVATDGPGPDFFGCDFERDKSDSTTICRGSNIRFRAVGGKYQVKIGGSGIYLSTVGHGQAYINGAGDNPDLASSADGTYSLNDGPYKSLPDFGATLQLAAPPGG
jgi:hypothetical protein